jgi:SulP family sulfate permease
VNLERSHYVHEIIIEAFGQLGAINWATFGIGVGGIALIMGVKKINKSIPGPLLAVLFGILAVWGLGLVDQGVKIVGTVPEGLPSFGLPSFSLATIQSLLPIALAISLVSFMESIAVAKAIQAKHKDYKVVPNQELIALGMANIGGSFFQSYPVTGGFSRTAINDQAGAKTGMASIISAVLIITTLLFLTPLFYFLPKAILASVIMVAVFGLIDIKEPLHLWRADRSDFFMLIITFIATLSLGIEQGIGIGVILSLAMIIFETTRPHIAQLGKVPGTHFYRNRERFGQVEIRKDLLIIRFDAQLYFANLNVFRERIDEWMTAKGPNLEVLIINAESINTLDSSALHLLEDLLGDLKARNCQLLFTGVKGPVRDALVKGHLVSKIGEDNFFMSVQEAVDAHDERKTSQGAGKQYREFTLQTNV